MTFQAHLDTIKEKSGLATATTSRDRLDIGLKLPGVEPTERFEASGSWNSMVTHRVRITDTEQADTQLLNWLADAYGRA